MDATVIYDPLFRHDAPELDKAIHPAVRILPLEEPQISAAYLNS